MASKNQYQVKLSDNASVYPRTEESAREFAYAEATKAGKRVRFTKEELPLSSPVYAEHWDHTHNVWHVWELV